MILENPHGKLVCPENLLTCTKAEIELLYDKLPPKENCIIKDLESHNGDLFFDYKNEDGTEFAIEWDEETQSFYASPIDLVRNLIKTAKETDLTIESDVAPIERLVEIFRLKYAQFVDEIGRPPRIMEITFESGEEVLSTRRKISGMAEAATKPTANEEPDVSSPVMPIEEEDLKDDHNNDALDEYPSVFIKFNPIIATAAFKILRLEMSNDELAEKLGITSNEFIRLCELDFQSQLSIKTLDSIKEFLDLNKQHLSRLMSNREDAQSKLTEREFEQLLEFTNSDGFEESGIHTQKYIEFNPTLAGAAFKVLLLENNQTEIAEDVGMSRAHFNKLKLNGFTTNLKPETVRTLKLYLLARQEYINQLFRYNQLVKEQLSEDEFEELLKFFYCIGFAEEGNSDTNEAERDWKFYTFQALRLRDGVMNQQSLAKEVGISIATLGKFLNGKSKRLRRNTEKLLQNWVKNNASKLLEHLCDSALVNRADLNDEDKRLLEEHLRTFLPEEPKFERSSLDRLNYDFTPALGIAAIKLASAADTRRGIAGEIGVLYENISRYASGQTKSFNIEIGEKVRKWLFVNMDRLRTLLQDSRYSHVLSSEEATILDEFLFDHKDYKPNE